MESYNIKTASAYINNLLLARGLLRDGRAIEFAHPSRGEGGKEQTMARIINLVHDLILKRDRDQEYRESVAGTLRTLRSESSRQTSALEKLQTHNQDIARQVSLAQSQERIARVALRNAESSARSLREEMVRLKITVQQVRISCANDIRKRDIQIQRLKSHLVTQQRGNKTGLVGASITINPGNIGLSGSTSTLRDEAPDLDDPEYSLKQETTEFLTQLSQSLSDENDNLIGLVRSTLVTLKELQGMPEPTSQEQGEGLSVLGEEGESARQAMLHAIPTNYDALAINMDTVLDNLKNLLTNPNFVAVDEVELREEEIHRLRAGWEKMEARLREAFTLMDSWRKRMTNGDTINLDELKMGLGLSVGLEAVNKEDMSIIEEDDDEDTEDQTSSDEDAQEPEEQQEPTPLQTNHTIDITANPNMFKPKLQPIVTALRETDGNKSPIRSPRKVAFSASIPNTPTHLENENAVTSGMDLIDADGIVHPTSFSKVLRLEERSPRPANQHYTPCQVRRNEISNQIIRLVVNNDFSSSTSPILTSPTSPKINAPYQNRKKRHSSPRSHPDEPSPKLTVLDKLAQAEADAAAVTEGLTVSSAMGAIEDVEVEAVKRKRRATRSPTKTRIKGRPKRRKSTLTPEELENLLGC